MSKYIVSLLSEFSDFDDEIPRVDSAISFNKEPTFKEAYEAFEDLVFFDKDGWKKIDDETWEAYSDSDYYEYGDPLCYQIKIQTLKQHKEMVDNWIEYIKLSTTPEGVANVTN